MITEGAGAITGGAGAITRADMAATVNAAWNTTGAGAITANAA